MRCRLVHPPVCRLKAEVRFDPTLTKGEAIAEGVTSLGYGTRHLSTSFPGEGVASREGTGDKPGARGTISLEVSGMRGPGCVSKVRSG